MICLDTAPLIWGVQGVEKPEQRGMVARTRRYLRYLQATGEEIIVPTPVMVEYLSGFPVELQAAQQAVLEAHFRLPSLDPPAGAIAAQLNANRAAIREARTQSDEGRQSLKTDVEIIAIAIANGAQFIVTNNLREFLSLAQGRIEIRDIPDIREQLQLPLDP